MSDDPKSAADRIGDRDGWTRRTYLVATTGTAAGAGALSGCSSGDDGEEGGGEDGDDDEDGGGEDGDDDEDGGGEDGDDDEDEQDGRPEGVSEVEFENGPVPDEYRTATSMGHETRNADEMTSRADVGLSEFAEAQESDNHVAGTCCANCADYISDENGDTWGACTKVEGSIAVEDWCTRWEPVTEEL